MEVQGKQVATRGVPSGYGYIRKVFKRQGWNMTKYWPVRLIDNNRQVRHLYRGEEMITTFSRTACIEQIKLWQQTNKPEDN